jgi:hypothetical protein
MEMLDFYDPCQEIAACLRLTFLWLDGWSIKLCAGRYFLFYRLPVRFISITGWVTLLCYDGWTTGQCQLDCAFSKKMPRTVCKHHRWDEVQPQLIACIAWSWSVVCASFNHLHHLYALFFRETVGPFPFGLWKKIAAHHSNHGPVSPSSSSRNGSWSLTVELKSPAHVSSIADLALAFHFRVICDSTSVKLRIFKALTCSCKWR